MAAAAAAAAAAVDVVAMAEAVAEAVAEAEVGREEERREDTGGGRGDGAEILVESDRVALSASPSSLSLLPRRLLHVKEVIQSGRARVRICRETRERSHGVRRKGGRAGGKHLLIYFISNVLIYDTK